MDYMRHAMKTKDAEIDVLKRKWQEYQEVQERMSNYEKDRMGEKDLLRKRAEQIDALQHKVVFQVHLRALLRGCVTPASILHAAYITLSHAIYLQHNQTCQCMAGAS